MIIIPGIKGDIEGVTAGDGLSGGGTDGTPSLALDLHELTAAAVADGDFIPIIDTNDSNGSRKEAVHDLATLFSGTGLTATNSVIAVDAAQSQITTVGTIGTGEWAATDVAVSHGGTGASTLTANGVLIGNGTSAISSVAMATKGHILIGDGSGNPQMLSVGSNDQVLVADSGETTGVKWAAASAGAVTALNSATANELVTVGATTTELDAEANLTYASDLLTINSSSANLPRIDITNTHAGATSATIRFNKDSASGDDNDVMGIIEFYGTDASEATHERLAYIDAYVVDATAGGEQGGIRFYVAENAADLALGLSLVGQAEDGEVDVTIGAGAASVTTIAGTLTMGTTASMTNAGLLSVGNQTGITGVGTITSGAWTSSTVVASAYLDADTAHLSATQTFSGAKTFSSNVVLGDGVNVNISVPLLATTDHTSSGMTAQMLAGAAIAAQNLVCIHTVTQEVVVADASAYATARVIGMNPSNSAISDTATGTILLQGFVRDDTWTWTPGGTLYLSETAGAMTHTAPTTSGAFVVAVGVALSPDVVYFNPDQTVIEVA